MHTDHDPTAPVDVWSGRRVCSTQDELETAIPDKSVWKECHRQHVTEGKSINQITREIETRFGCYVSSHLVRRNVLPLKLDRARELKDKYVHDAEAPGPFPLLEDKQQQLLFELLENEDCSVLARYKRRGKEGAEAAHYLEWSPATAHGGVASEGGCGREDTSIREREFFDVTAIRPTDLKWCVADQHLREGSKFTAAAAENMTGRRDCKNDGELELECVHWGQCQGNSQNTWSRNLVP